jgi:hypothetical protein
MVQMRARGSLVISSILPIAALLGIRIWQGSFRGVPDTTVDRLTERRDLDRRLAHGGEPVASRHQSIVEGARMAVSDLWEATVGVYLRDDLWTDRDQYDAGHFLMVPLHAAFQRGHEPWQREFAEQFRRFAEKGYGGATTTENGLARLHYLYLCSRFVVLADRIGKQELIPPGLVEHLYQEIQMLWRDAPAWQWGRSPFPGGIQERVAWKLSLPAVNYSYYPAIIDEECFVFAIAADLRAHERMTRAQSPGSRAVDEVLNAAQKVFQQRVVPQSGGGWLFQPGVWADHPDFAYAGRMIKMPGMEPFPLPDVAEDTSHSHRFPLWLTSLADAYAENAPEQRFYAALKAGLERQFCERVLVEPTARFPAYRTMNYMDGRNGVYRWQYPTQGRNNGYGPYELSGTYTLGWWAFLNTHRIRAVYRQMARQFPLPPEVIDLYVGPNTSRERHPLISDPQGYRNGFRELIVRLASTLGTE